MKKMKIAIFVVILLSLNLGINILSKNTLVGQHSILDTNNSKIQVSNDLNINKNYENYQISEKTTSDTESVLITFTEKPDNSILEKIGELGGMITKYYDHIPVIAANVPTTAIDTINDISTVRSIDSNDWLQISGVPDSDEKLPINPEELVVIEGTPNDNYFDDLWGMKKIKAPEAWDIQTDASTIVVAVIDEGIDVNHVDLVDNIWINAAEIPDNGIDDDNNGYIDDIYGWDFYYGDNSVYDGSGEDTHGTHVAGTIGAIGNNGIGVVGVCWNVQIMSLKFLGPYGGYTEDAISAIEYATMMGADIISASWGGGSYNEALKQAIEAFPGLFIAAAGNSGDNTDIYSHYPSSYDSDNIISVASSNSDDAVSVFTYGASNYGAVSVDLAAPGSDIVSTYPENQYAVGSGTSMATPHVSGTAALLLAYDPLLTPAELKARILDFADPVLAFQGKCVTGARLNVWNAITETPPPPLPPPPPTNTITVYGSVSADVKDSWHYFGITALGVEIQAVLSWETSADIDMYLYSPTSTSWVTRAYTLNNPEVINYQPTITGVWAIKVRHYSGVASDYTLEITYPVIEVSDDTIAPSVTINSPTGVIFKEITIDATITDNENVNYTDYRIDEGQWHQFDTVIGDSYLATLNTELYEDGEYTLVVRAADKVGNVGSSMVTIVIDNVFEGTDIFEVEYEVGMEDPVHYISVTALGTIKATLSWVAVSYTDLDMFLYEPGIDPYDPYGWVTRAFTVSHPEFMTWEVISEDLFGTWAIRVNRWYGPDANYTLEVDYPITDTIAPEITITSPTGTMVGTLPIEAEITDNHHVYYAEYRIDDGDWYPLLKGNGDLYAAMGDTSDLSGGDHVLTVRAFDLYGNTASTDVTFTFVRTLHIESIVMSAPYYDDVDMGYPDKFWGFHVKFRIIVTVTDQDGNPVAGVFVFGHLKTPSGHSLCIVSLTDCNGEAQFLLLGFNPYLYPGDYTFEVCYLFKCGYFEYDPSANVVDSAMYHVDSLPWPCDDDDDDDDDCFFFDDD